MILGADPLPQLPGRCDGHPPCGLLGVFSDEPTEPVWMFDTGYWYSCTACGRHVVGHRRPPFIGRPCAHRGDNNAGPVDPATVRGCGAKPRGASSGVAMSKEIRRVNLWRHVQRFRARSPSRMVLWLRPFPRR